VTAPDFTDDDLHPLVDGRLPPGEAALAERRLRAGSALGDKLSAWRLHSGALAAAYAPVLDEPLPLTFLDRKSRNGLRSRRLFLAGLVLGLPIGIVIGLLVGRHWL
jgi:anti-sigma factor RsiW